jgi:hypothetical protein
VSVLRARTRVTDDVKKQNKAVSGSCSADRRARRALAEEEFKDFVDRTVATAPPLTQDQRDRLTLLLRGPRGAP